MQSCHSLSHSPIDPSVGVPGSSQPIAPSVGVPGSSHHWGQCSNVAMSPGIDGGKVQDEGVIRATGSGRFKGMGVRGKGDHKGDHKGKGETQVKAATNPLVEQCRKADGRQGVLRQRPRGTVLESLLRKRKTDTLLCCKRQSAPGPTGVPGTCCAPKPKWSPKRPNTELC